MKKALQKFLENLPAWLGVHPEQPLTIDGNGLSTIEVHTDKVGRMVGLSVTFHDKAQSEIVERISHEKGLSSIPPSPHDDFHFSKKHPKQATILWTKEEVPPQAFDDAIFAFLDILVDRGHITQPAIEKALKEYYPHTGKAHHLCGAGMIDGIDITVSNPRPGTFIKPVLLEMSLNNSFTKNAAVADTATAMAAIIQQILYEQLESVGSLSSPSTPEINGRAIKIALSSLSDAEYLLEGLEKRGFLNGNDVTECQEKLEALQPTKHITMPVELHDYLEKRHVAI